MTLYLVGTVYNDPKGHGRLKKLLEHHKPASVSIDFGGTELYSVSPTGSEIAAGIRFFDDLNAKLRRTIAGRQYDPRMKELLCALYCSEGWAYRTPMALQPELGYKLFFVADPKGNMLVKNFDGDGERFWEYFRNNESRLRQTPLPDFLEEMQRAVDAVYYGSVISGLSPRNACFGKVGKEVAHYDRLIRIHMPEMHIGELFHMVHADGLMARLADLNPTLVRLSEADKL